MINEAEWEQTVVQEARLIQEQGYVFDKHGGDYLVWWRPEYVKASHETPELDTAYVLEVK